MTLHRAIRGGAAALAAAALLLLTACSSVAGSDSSSDYVTDGKLTIGTGEPAYAPWVEDDAPESRKGFESAVAYAVAEQLGFEDKDVVWVRTTFDEAIAPGPKSFDLNLQQFSITDERKQNVDMSTAYYESTQAVVTIEGSKAAGATSIAELKGLLIGAQTGTTSFDAIEAQIAPTSGAQVYNTNEDAILALTNGQVDAIVVDLPTALYVANAELEGGLIVGQLPPADGKTGDELGFVLPKDSPLTDDVSAAVDALREDGTLDELASEWLAETAGAPVLK
jgi:polar amino acid transport system substrate-binding protein